MSAPCPACGMTAVPFLKHSGREYQRCGWCGTIFVPGAEPPAEFYGENYFDKFRRFSGGRASAELNKARLDFVKPYLAFEGNRAAVLDFGCGSGDWLNDFHEAVRIPIYSVAIGMPCLLVGVDVNPAARAFIKSQFPHVRVFETLGETPKNYAETFDLLTAFDVVEHFANPNEIMPRLAGFIRRGGLLMFSTPYLPASGFTPEQFKDWRHCRPLEHFCHFTTRGLVWFLGMHGFDVFTIGHPEDGIRKADPNGLSAHNILTVVARKQ